MVSKTVAAASVVVAYSAALMAGSWLVGNPPQAEADPRPSTVTLDVRNDQVTNHDFGTPGMNAGDMDVFSDILSINGAPVGRDGGVCYFTNVTPDNPITYCELTIQLERGQVFARSLGPHTSAPFTMTITGGTGEYSDAHGELTVSGVASPSEKYELKFSK